MNCKSISSGVTFFSIMLLLLLFVSQANTQTGCHALFTSHPIENTLTTNFTDASTSPHSITSWLWDFGDGHTSTSQNPSHTYAHGGTYYVCLSMHDAHGCSSTYCHNVTVHPVVADTCHSSFTFHTVGNILTIDFTDASTSPHSITSWLWDFGDGHTSTLQNPSHTYTHGGTYYVCLSMHDAHGCSSTYCHNVTVHPVVADTCHSSFTFHLNKKTTKINFIDASTSPYAITSWLWDFGDGHTSTLQNPTHTYLHSGTHLVCLTMHDMHGCISTYCHHVIVNHYQQALVASTNLRTKSGTNIIVGDQQYIMTYPNPSSAFTTIKYELTNNAFVKLEIYDVTGNSVMQVKNENQYAGEHVHLVNTDVLNTGLYIIKMIVDDELFFKKITISK